MKLHKEGFGIMAFFFVLIFAIDFGFYLLLSEFPFLLYALWVISAIFYGLVVSFFRVPYRSVVYQNGQILAPSDGKVVVIEEVEETEYFKDKRRQISIFMSPLNVHCQWFPIKGVVKYFKYHPGLYLVAWHPKSSTENERTTIVVEGENGEVLFRQIAGAVARRIKFFKKEGDEVDVMTEAGFIKFGSRIDVFLPLSADIKVVLNQKVQGKYTVLAEV